MMALESPPSSSDQDAALLEAFLAPLSPKDFIEREWGRRPLHLRGSPERVASVFDLERFRKAVARGSAAAHRRNFQVSAIVEDFDGANTCTEPIDEGEIGSTLSEGATVCVHDIGVGDDRLDAFGQAIRRAMRFGGGVSFNCYLSPDRSGADTHFDQSITTAIQISGRKRWRYSTAPALAWPPANARLESDGTRQWTLPWLGVNGWDELPPVTLNDFAEVVLEPGDILCLPAGTWHSAKALGQSLALNMTFSPLPTHRLLAAILGDLFEQNEAWRAGPPPAWHEAGDDGQLLAAPLSRYLDARLAEVRGALAQLSADDPRILRLWRDLVASER